MKSPRNVNLTAFGIITAITLIALSVYVIEDLPAYGDENSPANKRIKLFSIVDQGYTAKLNASILPVDIKNKIEEMGFSRAENYPPLDEGNYEIEWVEEGTLEGPWFYKEGGWNILIKEGELFYHEPIKYYFVTEEDGNLSIFRYNFPVRVTELCEEETGIGNVVTAGLADYRGYDTMGEETVILTGAVCVILLLRRRGKL
jgi:multicomponent Na+:H+ antiporter subunit B